MWAQTWSNIADLTVPYPGKISVDVTPAMLKQVRAFKTFPRLTLFLTVITTSGLHAQEDVRDIGRVFPRSRPHTDARRVLARVHHRKTAWPGNGVSRFCLGFLQWQRLPHQTVYCSEHGGFHNRSPRNGPRPILSAV